MWLFTERRVTTGTAAPAPRWCPVALLCRRPSSRSSGSPPWVGGSLPREGCLSRTEGLSWAWALQGSTVKLLPCAGPCPRGACTPLGDTALGRNGRESTRWLCACGGQTSEDTGPHQEGGLDQEVPSPSHDGQGHTCRIFRWILEVHSCPGPGAPNRAHRG